MEGAVTRRVQLRARLTGPLEGSAATDADRALERTILDTGLVRSAVARTVEDEDGNPYPVAYVVAIEETRASRAAIRVAIRERLGAGTPVPELVGLADLPVDATGDPDFERLPPPPPPRRPSGPGAPRTGWAAAVAGVWSAHLGLDSVGMDDDLFELGANFRDAVQIIKALRSDHGVRVSTVDLVEHPTFGAFVARTDPAAPHPRRRRHTVARVAGGARRPPLFLIPGAGAHGGSIIVLARELDRPVYGLQARGLESDGLPHRTIEGLAAFLARAIRAVEPTGPVLVGGHSYGAVVALEVARQLVAKGVEVPRVILLDPPETGGDFVATDALGLPELEPGTRLALRERLIRTARGRVRRNRLTRRVVANGLRDRGRGVRRDFYRYSMFAAARFRPTPWPGPALVCWSEDEYRTDPRPDLDELLAGPRVEVEDRGSHLTMLEVPHAAGLAADIEAHLAESV